MRFWNNSNLQTIHLRSFPRYDFKYQLWNSEFRIQVIETREFSFSFINSPTSPGIFYNVQMGLAACSFSLLKSYWPRLLESAFSKSNLDIFVSRYWPKGSQQHKPLVNEMIACVVHRGCFCRSSGIEMFQKPSESYFRHLSSTYWIHRVTLPMQWTLDVDRLLKQ